MNTCVLEKSAEASQEHGYRPLRILTLSCVFPSSCAPEFGIFVLRRVLAMAKAAFVKVVAPVPLIDYSRHKWGKRRSAETVEERLEVHYPRWFYPPIGGACNAMFLALRVLGIAKKLRGSGNFDLIDAHFGFPDGIAAALLSQWLGIRFTVTVRGNEPMHARQSLKRLLLGQALRRANLVICVSEELRRFVVGLGVEEARTALIPNGVEASIFYRRDKELCRTRHRIPQGGSIVLSAGSLIERKGHHHAIQAVSRLRQEGRDVSLIIAGGAGREGNFEQQIRNEVARLGLDAFVRITGAVSPEELAEYMCAADVLCLASSREGWPNVVHEALASGLPVVCTNVGAVSEMVPSRSYGRVVQPGDADALCSALADVLDSRWDHSVISQWGHARSWDQVGREVLEKMELMCRGTDWQRR